MEPARHPGPADATDQVGAALAVLGERSADLAARVRQCRRWDGTRRYGVVADAVTITLVPLTVDHAETMVEVLADPALYAVIGGEPPTLEDLRERYRRQVQGGPADGSEQWRNWIVAVDRQPVGYVQATVRTRRITGPRPNWPG